MLQKLTRSELSKLRTEFAQCGVVRIENLLDRELADECSASVAQITDWKATVSDEQANARYFELTDDYAHEVIGAALRATSSFQFHFELRELTNGGIAGLPLCWRKLRSCISGAVFRDLCSRIGAISDAVSSDGVLTRISRDHYFGLHWDRTPRAGLTRKMGYALCLMENWQTDWGGATLLWDDNLGRAAAFRPIYNSLLLFSLPRPHSIEPVAAFVKRARLMVSGFVYCPLKTGRSNDE